MAIRPAIRGVRFAPSPTGVFHIGNLRTAWVSHRIAKLLKEPWIVRFEDIDRPRVVAGAMQRQLADMASIGLIPHSQLVQSELSERHLGVFLRAVGERRIYPCTCSRKEVQAALAGMASAPHGKLARYSGWCRNNATRARPDSEAIAWRFRMDDESGADDFIVARAALDARGAPATETFAPAYSLACAVDDFDGIYRLLVRAVDLADVLEEQRAIQRMLLSWIGGQGVLPAVYHCSLVTSDSGERLEKRTKGVTLAELVEAGHSPTALAAFFERSFTPPASADIRPEAILAETKLRLTVGELTAPWERRD